MPFSFRDPARTPGQAGFPHGDTHHQVYLGPGARVEGVGKAPRTACWNSLFFPRGREVASLGTQRSPRACFLSLLVIGYVYYPPSKFSH